MSKTLSNIASIVRKVTARTDQSIGDQTIYDYIQDFYQLEMGQEVRLFDEQGWFESTLTASTDEYTFDAEDEGYSLLLDPAYVDGYRVDFYTQPEIFFAKYPEIQTFDEQRPTNILYYDKKLIFRPPPDDDYKVKIKAYKINPDFLDDDNNFDSSLAIAEDYWWRYIAYGTALDILSDGGEFEKYGQVFPIFERYKDMVNARTYSQLRSTKAIRNF